MNTPLYRACANPNSSVDLIRRLIDEDPEALTEKDSRGSTPLNPRLFRQLHGEKPNYSSSLGEPAGNAQRRGLPGSITIMLGLVKAGTRINNHVRLDTKQHAHILEAVSGAPDSLYLHLRNNPSLCCRSTRPKKKIKRVQRRPTKNIRGASERPQ
jgi:hypothetical protein